VTGSPHWHVATSMADDRSIEPHVLASLDALNVPYATMEVDPDLADTATFCQTYDVVPEDAANCIVVASRDDPPALAACVVLATQRLDVNGTVRRRLGVRKVSFAPADLTHRVTGMTMGGVTPFGLPDDLALWIDPAVLERGEVVVGGGSRSMKIRVAPEALLAAGGEVIDALATSD
jgi:prolyl-tRNA editing enzyme YbaK/EbsC (Cys-tRNA(Pro) deacylase)